MKYLTPPMIRIRGYSVQILVLLMLISLVAVSFLVFKFSFSAVLAILMVTFLAVCVGFCIFAYMYGISVTYAEWKNTFGVVHAVRDVFFPLRTVHNFREIYLPEFSTRTLVIWISRLYPKQPHRTMYGVEVEQLLKDLHPNQLKKGLLLGAGGGSFAWNLLNKVNTISMDLVEVCPDAIAASKNFFLTDFIKQCNFLEEDAFDFISNTSRKYDIVLVDIFLESEVPSQIFKKKTIISLRNLLQKQGVLILNFGVFVSQQKIEKSYARLLSDFSLYKTKSGLHTGIFINR